MKPARAQVVDEEIQKKLAILSMKQYNRYIQLKGEPREVATKQIFRHLTACENTADEYFGPIYDKEAIEQIIDMAIDGQDFG